MLPRSRPGRPWSWSRKLWPRRDAGERERHGNCGDGGRGRGRDGIRRRATGAHDDAGARGRSRHPLAVPRATRVPGLVAGDDAALRRRCTCPRNRLRRRWRRGRGVLAAARCIAGRGGVGRAGAVQRGGGSAARDLRFPGADGTPPPGRAALVSGLHRGRSVHQAQGHGAALLRAALERSDLDGLPACVEATTPDGRRLYERHGFGTVGVIQAGESPPMWPMLRPVR